VDWFDLTHWGAILAAVVAIGTPIVAMLGLSSHYYAGSDRSLNARVNHSNSRKA
jgi:hypothetical protein